MQTLYRKKVQLEPRGYITHYLVHNYTLIWPQESWSYLMLQGRLIPVASRQALNLHRQLYPEIVQADQTYLQEQWNTSSLPTQQALSIQESQENT